MTDIPGTGKLSSNTPKIETNKEVISSIVNVGEIRREKEGVPIKPEENLWYNKLWFWILSGTLIAVPFALLGFLNQRFLIFAPLGPIIGLIAWFTRKITRKYVDKSKYVFK